jgi:hypothetical protein
VVGSLIPFRGIIRELSGANDQQRKVSTAIQAGVARRAYLKGVGQQRGCAYPARAATREMYDQKVAAMKALDQSDEDKTAETSSKTAQ